jgi:NhaP-type Na+/H+ or K+/H+ antiporter
MFRNIELAEAGLIGAVLAPTDASLGQAIVKNERIPDRIRQALDVESGLNDGGAVPFFALFLIIAQAEAEHIPLDSWLTFAAEQIVIGIVIGVIAGLVGGWLLNKATGKAWMERGFQPIALIALALATWLIANSQGGSGFIAAYIAGLMLATTRSRVAQESIELSGTEAEALGLGVFFILGLAMASIFPALDLVIVIYAVLSLTVVRMVPVALSLLGTRLDLRSVLFMGWFGPRGLASIVLMLTAMGLTPEIPGIGVITAAVFTTVLIIIFAHGITVVPAIDRVFGKNSEGPP